jgi:hypothetical protein
VEREWEQGRSPSYVKRTPGLKYGFEMELWPEPTTWTWHGFARFGLGSLPPGLQVVSAELWSYQYFAWHPTTSVDHLTLDPIQATAEEIWTASGTEICTLQLHSQSGWVVRQLNQTGRDAIEADVSKGWFAVRINNEDLQNSYGTAYGAGHDLEPRIKITYRSPGIQESPVSTCGRQTGMTLIRSMLLLPGERDAALLNTGGRKVMTLLPGPNDIRNVAPGAYFVRSAESGERSAVSVRKVVIRR